MASNVYEVMFIFDPNAYARDPNGVSGRIDQMVEAVGGEILASRFWNEQKLAYPINNHRKGTYWLTYFRMEADRLSEFNRACQLNDSIVRNLVLKVDPRLVETLVAHAKGERVPGEEDAGDESTKDESTTGEPSKDEGTKEPVAVGADQGDDQA